MVETKFFVYGSMSEGLVHFNKIRDFVFASAPAKVKGSAYQLKVGFPVLLEAGESLIPGQMMSLKANELLLSLLDSFHGIRQDSSKASLHTRIEKRVLLENGMEDSAWVYFMNPDLLPANAKRIDDGDWVKALQEQPPLTQKLTERQRNYIQRLGSSSGREIVPIDLVLYRELMNLELIVDKGRRLALSKLGNEVFRYLS